MGSGGCRSGLGSLWGRLLGLLSDLRLHLGFKLSLGLAPLPLRRLELLLLRLGLVFGWLRPQLVSRGCGAKPSSGVEHAGTADPSAGWYVSSAGSAAGGSRSWTSGQGSMGLRARSCAQARSSASGELQWTYG